MKEVDQIRHQGLRAAFIGTVLFGAAVAIAMWISYRYGDKVFNLPIVTLALPGAYGLMGVYEFSTGRRFSSLGERFNALPYWKQWVVGITAALVSFLVVFTIVMLTVILPGIK